MHVFYFVDSLGSGGAQRQIVEIARALHLRHGVRVSVGVYHDIDFHGPRLREAGIPVVPFFKRSRIDPTLVSRLRAWIARERPDVVHAFLIPSCVWSRLAIELLPRARRPVFVAAERSALVATTLRKALMQRFAYRRADAVTANAAPVADELVRAFAIAPDRMHYLPNGIDLADWDAQAAGPCPIALERGRFHLALVGGLREEKDHGLLLEALARLEPAERADWQVWFIGGETGTPEYAAWVRAEVERRGFQSLVRIVPPTPRIAAILRRLDGLVMPSRFEGFPNILLEAMASALPSIATSVGNVPLMIEEGKSGFLVPPGDAGALAAALRRLRAMGSEDRARMGRAARAAVEASFRLDEIARRHLALYERLVAARADGSAR